MCLALAGCTKALSEEELEGVETVEKRHSVHEFRLLEGPREPTGLKLERAGFTYACMDCHEAIEAKWHYGREMVEHRHIELKHGTNRFCLNCHHPENRNAYVDYDGTEISASTVEELCHKCHGPQYRDWAKGIHGRPNGYWNTAYGVQERLKCTECHNPHDPAFKAMEPETAPTYPDRAAGKKEKRQGVDPHGGI